jgi:hypothetical protein
MLARIASALRTAALVAYICAAAPVAGAQAGSGEIRGEVRDPGGRIVPDASVTVLETRTNQKYAAHTDQEGVYGVSNEASLPLALKCWLQMFVQDGIRLTTGRRFGSRRFSRWRHGRDCDGEFRCAAFED